MFQFFKQRKPSRNAAGYAEEWRRLQDEYADPAIELAKTKQAVVVSAASVIDRLWNGHGGISWDESCEEDYVDPLREHLVNPDVFSASECATITEKLDALVAIGRRNIRRVAEAQGEETVLILLARRSIISCCGRLIGACIIPTPHLSMMSASIMPMTRAPIQRPEPMSVLRTAMAHH